MKGRAGEMRAERQLQKEKTIPAGEILDMAVSFGASLAGVASLDAVARSPSFQRTGETLHCADARSVIVMALEHPEDDPSMDWWDGNQGTRGNRVLIRTGKRICHWLKKKYGVKASDAPYYVKKGGLFLKDAAVLAGLGCIGKNNLLVTPQFGPRVRLRALFVDAVLESCEMLADFDPCGACDAPCHRACPQNAFETGFYDRARCAAAMERDEAKKRFFKNVGIMYYAGSWIKYCRACDLACPVGRH